MASNFNYICEMDTVVENTSNRSLANRAVITESRFDVPLERFPELNCGGLRFPLQGEEGRVPFPVEYTPNLESFGDLTTVYVSSERVDDFSDDEVSLIEFEELVREQEDEESTGFAEFDEGIQPHPLDPELHHPESEACILMAESSRPFRIERGAFPRGRPSWIPARDPLSSEYSVTKLYRPESPDSGAVMSPAPTCSCLSSTCPGGSLCESNDRLPVSPGLSSDPADVFVMRASIADVRRRAEMYYEPSDVDLRGLMTQPKEEHENDQKHNIAQEVISSKSESESNPEQPPQSKKRKTPSKNCCAKKVYRVPVGITKGNASFRTRMGPHLRCISAMLEICGSNLDSPEEIYPHELIRRFHPGFVHRTIERGVDMASDTRVSATEGPEWSNLIQNFNVKLLRTDEDASDARLCYLSPFGNPEKQTIISFRKDLEIDGKPNLDLDILSSVGSADLSLALNLRVVAENCENVEFKTFANGESLLLMTLSSPKCAGLLYESGMLYVIGTKSYQDFRKASRRLARQVQRTGAPVKIDYLRMHFYIGSWQLPFRVNVDAMIKHETFGKFAIFDKSEFPGVIFAETGSHLITLVFETGLVVMTVAKTELQMRTTMEKMYPCLRLFACR